MRAPPTLLTMLLGTMLALGAGCSDHVLTPIPTGDGYGPAGGGEHSSGGPTGSSSGTSTSPPSTSSGGSGGGSTGSGSSSGGGASTGGGGGSTGSGSSGGGGGSSGGSGGGGTGGTGFDAGTPSDAGGGHDAGSYGDGGDVSTLLPLCVSQINEFRNQNGQSPLEESTAIESYASAAAASDAHNGQLHSYFYATSGGDGVVATEDELDGAKIAPAGSAQQTMEQGLQSDEQANGNAAANLLDDQFSQVGCGFGQDASGNWWVVIGLR